MRVNLKLITGISVLFLGCSFLANAQSSMNIYSPDTNTGTTIYFGPVMPATTTNSSSTGATSTSTVGTVPVCTPVLLNFHRRGELNQEVAQLQNFLNQYNGANLNGLGYYGPATEQEVKNLQYTYGIKVTGVQHEKTTALINSIKCGNIAVKARMIAPYESTPGNVGGNVSVTTGNNTPVNTTNVYPNANVNANGNTQVTPTPVVKTPTKNTGSMRPATSSMATNSQIEATSTNSFMTNLKGDFQKIKDNYKAYVLVFILILALFWFLRKAATE